MDNDEMPMTYLTPLPTFGDTVRVPEGEEGHHGIAIITSDPDHHGRVRLEWDDEKSQHHWKYYARMELEIVESDEHPGWCRDSFSGTREDG